MWFIMWFWFVFLHCFTQWYHIWCKHILLQFKWIYAFSFKIPTTSIALVRWPAVQNANDWTHQKYAIFISGNYHENKTRNVERYRTLAISQSSTYGIVDVITVKSCISHDESGSHFIKLIFFIVIIAHISKQYRYGAPFGTRLAFALCYYWHCLLLALFSAWRETFRFWTTAINNFDNK